MTHSSFDVRISKCMPMKTIKVKCIGFWGAFDPRDNFILDLLKKRYQVELSDEPEYLFYSTSTEDFLDYDCVRIFYTGENVCPDFNLCDYAIGFERLTFADRYLRRPFYLDVPIYREDLDRAMHKHEFRMEDLKEKTEFCSFIYSNKESDPFRDQLLDKINSYKAVHSGGRYRNNIGGSVDDKFAYQWKHKFSIASENSYHSGYSTEKLVQSLAALTIPIYWGDPSIARDFNEKAFINCHQYDTLDEILERVIEIDQNEELYLKMLREPAFYPDFSLEEKRRELEEFIYHIIDQPYEKAFRKTRYCWGAIYEANAKRHRKMDRMAEKLLKIFHR